MLAGRRAFEGDSQARLIAAIEKDEVPRLPPPAKSPALDRLVRQCPVATQTLRKIPASGGLAVDIVSLKGMDFPVGNVSPMGAAWAEDGRIYLGSRSGTRGGIRSVPAEGGELKEVTRIDRSRESGHRLPWALPGGRALLFTAMANEYGLLARIEAVSLASGERKVVVEDAADPRYLPTGHLLFIRQGIAMAAPFDLERLELRAAPMPVIAGVQQALNMGGSVGNSGAGQLAVSPSGLLAYASGSTYVDAPAEFVLVVPFITRRPEGRRTAFGCAAFSPDGRWLAYVSDETGVHEVYVTSFPDRAQTFVVSRDGGLAPA
jgi:serine/threonine-protein kinase